MKKIIIGCRGSELSLKQTDIIKNLLLSINPSLAVSVEIITTKGDKDMSSIPLDSVGKGWFTKEIDRKLLDGSIDIAVHSLKDLSEALPGGLMLAAVSAREDAREVLVSKTAHTFETLPRGAIIGTDSTRRACQILHKRPDLVVKSIRGNVNTRLAKLQSEQYDALLLAAAGIKRLNLESVITQYFEIEDFIPSPGQGALAVVIKKSNKAVYEIAKQINHKESVAAIEAERAFSAAVSGGCKTPVGAYAFCKKETIVLTGLIGSIDGKHIAKGTISGAVEARLILAKKLAKRLLKKTVIITRQTSDNHEFKKKLTLIEGISVVEYPTIATIEQIVDIAVIKSYDWIVFTSKRGVTACINQLKAMNIDIGILKQKKIAVVGPGTAAYAKKYGLPIAFMPTIFTTESLGQEISPIQGKQVLLLRSNSASNKLESTLKRRGATVRNLSIYKTVYPKKDSGHLSNLVLNNEVSYIIFTSSSTVTGFIKSIVDSNVLKMVLHIPIISIGPVTTQTAQKAGFTTIQTASPHTIDGVVATLQQLQKS